MMRRRQCFDAFLQFSIQGGGERRMKNNNEEERERDVA
jgi:hypothetical protein